MYTGGCLEGGGGGLYWAGGNCPLYDQLMIHAGLREYSFDFRKCISDEVNIHADMYVCIIDFVYLALITGVSFDIFGVLCCREAVVGMMEGLLGRPRADTR